MGIEFMLSRLPPPPAQPLRRQGCQTGLTDADTRLPAGVTTHPDLAHRSLLSVSRRRASLRQAFGILEERGLLSTLRGSGR
jgi:hypothetical protein